MRISRETIIAGIPALQLRKALRAASKRGAWDAASMAELLGIDGVAAGERMAALIQEGYVQVGFVDDGCPYYETTTKGNALVLASAGKPIKRAIADGIVREAMARVEAVNAAPELAYGVRKLLVFGSYLSEQPELGDVDLALELSPRFPDDSRQTEAERQRVENAIQSGKRLRSFLDRLNWPREEIFRLVKGGVAAISLHPTTDAVLATAATKILLVTDQFDAN